MKPRPLTSFRRHLSKYHVEPYNFTLEAMDRRATAMEALAGDLVSRYDHLLADNSMLLDEIKALKAKIKDINATVETLLMAIGEMAKGNGQSF